jgi:outer membrane protein assembly factor BamB
LIVVLALAAWLGAYFGTRSATPAKPSTTGLVKLWGVPTVGNAEYVGSWVTDSLLVFGDTQGITAYSMATGHVAWDWHAPAGGGVCQFSTAPRGGLGVFGYSGTGSSCSDLAALDLATGALAWSTPTSESIESESIEVGAHQAAVLEGATSGIPLSKVAVFDLATGALQWTTATDPAIASDCDFAGVEFFDGAVYGSDSCLPPNSGTNVRETDELYAFNQASGAIQWQTALKGACSNIGTDDLQLVTGYLLVNCDDSLNGTQTFQVLTPGSRSPAQISYVSATDAVSELPAGPLYPTNIAYGDTLYLMISSEPGFAIEAFDLATLRELWQQPLPGGFDPAMVDADAQGLLVALVRSDGMSTVTYAPSTGATTYGPGIALPSNSFLTSGTEVVRAGSRLAAVSLQIGGESNLAYPIVSVYNAAGPLG